MPDLNTLMERRANTWTEYQSVLERARTAEELSAEDRSTLERMDTALRTLNTDIEALERGATMETRLTEIDRSIAPDAPVRSDQATTDEQYRDAFHAMMRFGIAGVGEAQRSLLMGNFDPELRAQGVGVDAAGGYLVPEEYRRTLTETMLSYGAMLDVATLLPTTTGADMPWPSNDDTGNKGARVAENVQIGEKDLQFGTNMIKAWLYTSKVTRVSIMLLQDSAFDLDAFVPKKHGERIGRILNEEMTTGTGVEMPQGVATDAVVGKTGAAGQTTSVIGDDLIDLEHSVDVAYRNERSRFMFHDLTLAKLRKLKDGDGRYLWQPSVQAGVASTINGRPYTVNNEMPQMAADAKSILFGDFKAGYLVRLVRGIQAMRLTERYADYLQVGFLSFVRADGRIDDAAAFRAYKNAAA